MPKDVQSNLLDLDRHEWIYNEDSEEPVVIKYTTLEVGNKTIISTYSAKRAKKDKLDREERVETAKKLIANPSLLKKKQARYFLESTGKQTYCLDEEKIKRAEKYDGFLAISTNNRKLQATEVLDQNKQLYKIEHSFRSFKSHLETRPMFHWTDKRIEGHIYRSHLCYIVFACKHTSNCFRIRAPKHVPLQSLV